MTRRSWTFDAVIATSFAVLGVLEAYAEVGSTHRQGPHWVQAALYVATSLLLLGRRIRPMGCLLAITVVSVAEFAIVGSPEGQGLMFPAMIAAYSVARWERQRPAWWGLVLVVALWLAWVGFDPMDDDMAHRASALIWLFPWVIAWLVGALVRSQLANADQRREARAERATLAVAEERNRIARELHDVIGHSVSVMTVQTSAVRRRLDAEQTVEREALETVEAVGREALVEMRRMVGVLRQAGDHTDREPPPGLDQLDRLVEQFRAAGLPVEVSVRGDPQQLAPGLDLTAFRLVQEGLTNTLRHAVGVRRAEVSIDYGSERIRLAIRDDGRGGTDPLEAGNGLLGMKERVGVYGGDLVARPCADGGFELVATLPMEAV
jgi:signal transduction histidine kinase